MKAVLTSVDFVYNQDGILTPLELNTNTSTDYAVGHITTENFLEKTEGIFLHGELHTYMQSNNISNIKLITLGGGTGGFFKIFCEFYGYGFENIATSSDELNIPEVEDTDDTLIIRIAYDTYAIIDDLYARDNYEFLNLIASESFASPVCFLESNFDTISNFEPSQDGILPNYVIKSRTPGYAQYKYPKLYRLDSQEELDNLKTSLTFDEYIQKYEFNSDKSLIDSRTFHLRSMNLLIGNTLEVLNIHNYISQNAISTTNELLEYTFEIDSTSKQLDPLFSSKFYPTDYTRKALSYHHDETDFILSSDGSLLNFDNLQVGISVKDVVFNEQLSRAEYGTISDLDTYNISSSVIENKISNYSGGLFVNITANNDTYGEFNWYDGVDNRYLVNAQTDDDLIRYTIGGEIAVGDKLYIYNNSENSIVPFTVTSKSYDIKDIKGYSLSLSPNTEFFVQLDSTNNDLYLIQHNTCRPAACNEFGFGGCYDSNCFDCGKNSPSCFNCGGTSFSDCTGAGPI